MLGNSSAMTTTVNTLIKHTATIVHYNTNLTILASQAYYTLAEIIITSHSRLMIFILAPIFDKAVLSYKSIL